MDDSARTSEFIREFTRCEHRLHAYILTLMPQWSDAEDVLQATNLILWEKFGEFEAGTNFFAWACQIARYQVTAYRRKNTGRHLPFSESLVLTLADDAAAIRDELEERHAALSGCVAKLPKADRNLIQRRYADQSSTPRIAAEDRCSAEKVYKALARIRRVLHDCVGRVLASGGIE